MISIRYALYARTCRKSLSLMCLNVFVCGWLGGWVGGVLLQRSSSHRTQLAVMASKQIDLAGAS